MIRTVTGPMVVTGTDTGVGKTVVTAGLAAAARAAGRTVAVVKPAQTGTDDDAATITRLAEPDHAVTLARFPDPMSPFAAARRRRMPQLELATVVDAIRQLPQELVLVEGAGGLLAPMGKGSWTVADLCLELNAPAVIVARPSLGTINHTALTLEALRSRGILYFVVIGSWPQRPDSVELANRVDLSDMAYGLAGAVPEHAGDLPPDEFRAAAPSWFGQS